MSEYIRISRGLNNYKLYPIEQYEKTVNDIVKNDPEKDYYESVYTYTQKEYDHWLKNQSLSGIRNVTANQLVYDFDSKEDLNIAKNQTIECFDALTKAGFNSEAIQIYFSGGKGFHLQIKLNNRVEREVYEKALYYFKDIFPNVDGKIKDQQRLIRLPFTKNQDSGLYKIPLSHNELTTLSIDEIKDQAKTYKHKDKFLLYRKWQKLSQDIPKQILNYEKKEEKKEAVDLVEFDKNDPKNYVDFANKPYFLDDLKYILHQGFIPPTYGNEGMMILAATYKYLGFDRKDTYHVLKGVNEKRAEIYGDEYKRDNNEIWNQVINPVYSKSWQGGTYSVENSELLRKLSKDFGLNENTKLVNIKSLGNKFIKFAENINNNIIKTGIKTLDEKVMITTGMMVGILGAPSSGKTSMAISIVENLSENGQNVLFESLDMYDNLLFQRLVQRVSGVNVNKKLRAMVKDDPEFKEGYKISEDAEYLDAIDQLYGKYNNVDFNSNRGATVESIEEDIKMAKGRYGENLKLVVIDYLEKVRGPYTDHTANSAFVASRLSDLASTYDVCLIMLLQPQKSAGDPSEELLSMRKVKGASVIEQDCRLIMTLWRPGFNPKDSSDDKFASIAVVKNNMGEVAQLDYGWDGLRGNLAELTSQERGYLEALRRELQEQKEEENGSFKL